MRLDLFDGNPVAGEYTDKLVNVVGTVDGATVEGEGNVSMGLNVFKENIAGCAVEGSAGDSVGRFVGSFTGRNIGFCVGGDVDSLACKKH